MEKKEETSRDRSSKREEFSQFMGRLADDPVLKNNSSAGRYSLAEILHEAKYPLNQEFRYGQEHQKFVPVEQSPVIDAALLLTLLFQEKGLNRTSDDLVKHVLSGGSIEQFIQQAYEDNGRQPPS